MPLEQIHSLLTKYKVPRGAWEYLDVCISRQNIKPFYVDTSAWSKEDSEAFGVLLKTLQDELYYHKHQKKDGHVMWTYKEDEWRFTHRPKFDQGAFFVLVDAVMALSLTREEVMAAVADHVRSNEKVRKQKLEFSVHVARSTSTPYVVLHRRKDKRSIWRVVSA